eukprot:5809514-Prymnesium_polylepis.1
MRRIMCEFRDPLKSGGGIENLWSTARCAPAVVPRVPERDRPRQRTCGAPVQGNHGRHTLGPQESAQKHLLPDRHRAQGWRAARGGPRQSGGQAGGEGLSRPQGG